MRGSRALTLQPCARPAPIWPRYHSGRGSRRPTEQGSSAPSSPPLSSFSTSFFSFSPSSSLFSTSSSFSSSPSFFYSSFPISICLLTLLLPILLLPLSPPPSLYFFLPVCISTSPLPPHHPPPYPSPLPPLSRLYSPPPPQAISRRLTPQQVGPLILVLTEGLRDPQPSCALVSGMFLNALFMHRGGRLQDLVRAPPCFTLQNPPASRISYLKFPSLISREMVVFPKHTTRGCSFPRVCCKERKLCNI